MSTQNAQGIPLTQVAEDDQQHFRLLELPAELLTLLTSENPPILELKSSEGTPGVEAGGNVVLCTADKTWSLRQKNSSNTVHIVHPSQDADTLEGPSLEAIAKLQSTLEATPITTSLAAAYIKALLPVYSSTGHHVAREKFGKRELFDTIPFSERECEKAWRELAAFEMVETRQCFVPSATLKMQLWSGALEATVANGVDLSSPLSSSDLESMLEAKEDWPSELFEALVYAISDEHESGNRLVDVDRCVRWVGVNQLEVLATQHLMPVQIFTSRWKDSLPEKWRAMVKLSKVEGFYTTTNAGKEIKFKEVSLDAESGANTASAGGSKSTLGGKRKWHDKFRPAKKAG